jgi:hypothetical protein
MNQALNDGEGRQLTLDILQKEAAGLEQHFASGTFIAPFPELVIKLGCRGSR